MAADQITAKEAAALAARLKQGKQHNPEECQLAGRVITAMLRQVHSSDVFRLEANNG